MVMKPGTSEIIATSANQIVLLKFRQRYTNVAVLYSPDPRFLLDAHTETASASLI